MSSELQPALRDRLAARPEGLVFILTGAGISRESGLPTFRDAGGIWQQYRFEDLASPRGFQRDPRLVHDFYNLRRRDAIAAQPNAAHLALARLENVLRTRLLLVTQNIDDLHERAGSTDVVHMHGEIRKVRCLQAGHILPWDADADPDSRCPACRSTRRLSTGGSALRPHVVWFGEMPLELPRITRALEDTAVFCSIGTSGTVEPAASFVATAHA
ncbi:MAG: NAD-dependent deacylase, partial [Planctomycetes bacterium]|nr:NAD-dependent deacylase [Planctomycetota bacterium]